MKVREADNWRRYTSELGPGEGIDFISNLVYSLPNDKIIILYYDFDNEENFIPVILNDKHDYLNELQNKDTLQIKEIKLYKDDKLLIGITHREMYSEVWDIL